LIEDPIEANKRKYQIRRVDIDFMSDVVRVEAVDITTLAGGVFVFGDMETLSPRWEEAGGAKWGHTRVRNGDIQDRLQEKHFFGKRGKRGENRGRFLL
jgi:hypothetical protein